MESTQKIPLTQGKYAIVDVEDYESLSRFNWYANLRLGHWYAVRSTTRKNATRKKIYMHRDIIQAPKGVKVDHVNNNGLDNRKSNLRICSHCENLKNQGPRKGASKFKGAYWEKNAGEWRAQIRHNYKTIHIGFFESEIEAAEAYARKAKEMFGEFAYVSC